MELIPGDAAHPLDLDAFLASARHLLQITSTADQPRELQRAVDFVVDFVGQGFTVERFESCGKPSALLYPPHGGARPTFRVIFNGHLDVVPGTAEQFRPRREGDRLYGRGTHDMKIAALAQALVFRELAPHLSFPIALQLVADEEIGGQDGTGHQVQTGVASQFVVIGENTNLDVVTDSKGVVRARLRANGRTAHGAYPWLGRNALLAILNAVMALLARYPVPEQEAWRTTVNVAQIITPTQAANQVPAEAEAMLDIRFPAEDANLAGRTASEIGEYLQTLCGSEVVVTVESVTAPHHADCDNHDVKALQAAAQRVGFTGDFARRHGSNDGHYFSGRGMTAVSFGIGGSGQHGPEEYVDVPTIAPYCQALSSFLQALATE